MKISLAYQPYGWIARVHQHPVLLFNAEVLDGSTGGYPLGQGKRMYFPRIMRFASPDDFSPFLAGGLNAYAYCQGDPVNFTDPSGRVPTLKVLAQKALKNSGVISKQQKFVMKTIPLEWKREPTTVSLAFSDRYWELIESNRTPAQILSANQELKGYVKLHSRSAVINWVFRKGDTLNLALKKHKQLAERTRPFVDAYLNAHNISEPRVQERQTYIQGARQFGLNENDSQKLLKMIRGWPPTSGGSQ